MRLKVAFANEIGTLARSLGADGVEVMKTLCQDTKLNVSPAYLTPGFAFGGSCLPKDVRALVHEAQASELGTSLLGSIMASNEEHLQRAVEVVAASKAERIGVVGLSFKAGTDDLRESPYVALVEALLQRGRQVRIFDPEIAISRLRGGNRAYITQHLPHLVALMANRPSELCAQSDLILLCTAVAEEFDVSPTYMGQVIDLRTELVKPALVAQRRMAA